MSKAIAAPQRSAVSQPRKTERTKRPVVQADKSQRTQHTVSNPLNTSLADILQLQQGYGNRAVRRLIQRARTPSGGTAGGEVNGDLQNQLDAAHKGGRPLDRTAGDQMSGALGADFSRVRVHTDGQADNLNQSLNAQAFTTGSDIFFSRGAYSPGTPGGRELLAHELTHVVQQGGAAAPGQHKINRKPNKLQVGSANDKYEQEAGQVAHRTMTRGEPSAPIQQRASAVRIQRYGKATSNYTMTAGDNAPPMFETQSMDPEITAQNELRHKTENPTNPKLLFSADDTVAMQATAKKREAKEFYATDEVVTAANVRLTKVGSAVRLDNASGNSITNSAGQTLKMVLPRLATDTSGNPVTRDLDLGTNICIEVGLKMIGKSNHKALQHQAVFQSANTNAPPDKHIEQFTPTGKAPTEIYNLADYMAETDGAPDSDDMSKKMRDTSVKRTESGPEYGKKSSKGELNQMSKSLGVNQFAQPKVGEGFATYSTAKGKGGFSWGYHYAGVVARSVNGLDWVTLENYNRAGDVDKLRAKLYWKLMKENKRVIANRLAELERAGNTDLMAKSALTKLSSKTTYQQVATKAKDLIVELQKIKGRTQSEAESDYDEVVKTEPNKRWFFHLYGSGKGQSFHEQSAKSGFFTNPLTLRVRK